MTDTIRRILMSSYACSQIKVAQLSLIEPQLVIIVNERSMNYCPQGPDCRDPKCIYNHPWRNISMRDNFYPYPYHPQMHMGMHWGCHPGPPLLGNPYTVMHPQMSPCHPPFAPDYHMYYQQGDNFGAHPQVYMPQPHVRPLQQIQPPFENQQKVPKDCRPKKRKGKGCKDKWQKQAQDPTKELTQKMQKLVIEDINIEEGNAQMKEYGFKDESINKALLKHLKGDVQTAVNIMFDVEADYSEQDIRDFVEVHKKYLIIKNLDFHYAFKRHKILSIMAKCNNELGATLQRLRKKQQILLKKNKHLQKLAALKHTYQEVIQEQIPGGCEFLIDGFNIVYTNKHLRKLFYSNNLRNKVEAIIRLRILVESLAEGYLVLDKKFLSDEEEKQIQASIGVVINKPKKIKVVYADEDSIADQKIIEILTNMEPERRKNVLLVSGDHELIQKCLHINEGKLMLMNGKRFIKQAKSLHDKGVRKSILIRRH